MHEKRITEHRALSAAQLRCSSKKYQPHQMIKMSSFFIENQGMKLLEVFSKSNRLEFLCGCDSTPMMKLPMYFCFFSSSSR